MSHIFISYSRKDLDFAQKIVDALAADSLDTWVDWKSIAKGEDWLAEIYHGIERADAFLFLVSPHSVASEPCNREIVHAVRNGKRILPIFITNSEDKEVYAIAGQLLYKEAREEINRRNFIFCRKDRDDFGRAIDEVQTTIRTDYGWLRQHTELQVKALRWKHRPDNSLLLRGKELKEANRLLKAISKKADPQPTALQQEYIASSTRQSYVTNSCLSAIIVTMFCAIVSACAGGAILLDRVPATVTINGPVFEVRNRFNYRFLSRDVGSTIAVYAVPQELTPNGGYILLIGTDSDGERPGAVLAYDMRGRIQWEYRAGEDPYNGSPANFYIKRIIVDQIMNDGEYQVLVTTQKSDWYPSELVLLNARGESLSSYWNSGFIYDVLLQDFDGDSIKEVVVSAVNNNLGHVVVNDATKHPAIVYVLSPKEDFTGQIIPVAIPGRASGTEYNHWIAVFEPYTVTGIRVQIVQDAGQPLIEAVYEPQGGYIWMDASGTIRRVGLSDHWQSLFGEKSPADFVCFLFKEGDDWDFPAQVERDRTCPWYVRK